MLRVFADLDLFRVILLLLSRSVVFYLESVVSRGHCFRSLLLQLFGKTLYSRIIAFIKKILAKGLSRLLDQKIFLRLYYYSIKECILRQCSLKEKMSTIYFRSCELNNLMVRGAGDRPILPRNLGVVPRRKLNLSQSQSSHYLRANSSHKVTNVQLTVITSTSPCVFRPPHVLATTSTKP